MAKIAHARRDENGAYFGGHAGDQDGKEVCVTEWYNRPWNKVLRCVDSVAREMIARAAEAAAANDHIGYDQHQRTTLYRAAELTNFDISKIDIDCECDCSSLVAVCVNAAGIKVSRNMYTGNEAALLIESGQFVEVGGEILRDPELAQRGDIWLYEGHHTAIQTTYGSKVALYPIGWHKDKGGWWYADTVNTFLFDQWADIDGNRYYFDHKGYAAEGLQVINNLVYYFMEHGKRTLDGKDDGKLMITDSSGAMQPFEV